MVFAGVWLLVFGICLVGVFGLLVGLLVIVDFLLCLCCFVVIVCY